MESALYESTYHLEDAHWWFAGRRAIVCDAVRRALNGASRRPRILDLGCGTGRNLQALRELGAPVGLDIEALALRYSRERGMQRLVQARAEALPLRDESFDGVLALDLLEHLEDDVAGAREMFRVLRPQGLLIVSVPAYQWLWGPQDDVSHHCRRYTPGALVDSLRAAGFRIVRLTHVNLLLLPLILAGRIYLRATRTHVETENTLHPGWSNGLLRRIFSSERFLLRRGDLPLGVSIFCLARKLPISDPETPASYADRCAASVAS